MWVVVNVNVNVYKCCDGIWFGFFRSSLRLAVVLCWVDRCFGSLVLLGLYYLTHVKHLPWLVVPVLQSFQSPIWIRLVNDFHMQLQ